MESFIDKGKIVNSIIEEDDSKNPSVFYSRNNGIQIKITRNSKGDIINIKEVK